jgi:hypothetical protein
MSAWHLPDNIVPVIPVDVVTRFALVKIFAADETPEKNIFNVVWGVGSHPSALFTWQRFSEMTIQLGAVSDM